MADGRIPENIQLSSSANGGGSGVSSPPGGGIVGNYGDGNSNGCSNSNNEGPGAPYSHQHHHHQQHGSCRHPPGLSLQPQQQQLPPPHLQYHPNQYQESQQFFINCNNNNQPPSGGGYGGYCNPPPGYPHPYQQHQHQPHYQFGGGSAGNNYNSLASQPHPSQQQEHQHHAEPPPRPWMQLSPPKHKRACFTVLCYNILCSRYATHTLYSYCPGWALDWNYRRKAILQELIHYTPDIISLQEMETDQFYNFFLPQLQLLGYSGIFAAKSRARTMVESKRKLVDGCAIFYRTNKFRLLSEHLIEFSQVAIANATKGSSGEGGSSSTESFSEEMINRVQTKDNIALAALLETKMDSDHNSSVSQGFVNSNSSSRSRPLLVCTCHIHWDPSFCDVKLVQTMLLMQELRKITDNIEIPQNRSNKRTGSSSSSSSSSAYHSGESASSSDSTKEKVNLLVCGDFNSLPQSGVVQYMETGTVPSTHPDFKGHSYEGYVGGSGRGSPRGGTDSPTVSSPNIPESCSCSLSSSPESESEKAQIHLIPVDPPSSPSEDSASSLEDQQEFEEFSHDFNLFSAYPHDTLPFTNYTLEFQGIIDYVFHSVSLRPIGLLGPLDPSWLVYNNIVGAPHPCIPSDHLPLLVELEMITAN